MANISLKPEKVKKAQKENKKISYYQAVGRRKAATARVRLYVGKDGVIIKEKTLKKGEILINGRLMESYFPIVSYQRLALEPFRITETIGRFIVSSIISGGGPAGQLGAFVLGAARALEKADKEKYRPILKKAGFMSRDSRSKERRKAGFAQKARARKQSPKR